jgi:hypothetical protein
MKTRGRGARVHVLQWIDYLVVTSMKEDTVVVPSVAVTFTV